MSRVEPTCHPERRKSSASKLCVDCYREELALRREIEKGWKQAAGMMGRRPHGSGGICWRKRDQRWQGSYTDPTGIRRYVYGPSRAIVEQKLVEAIGEHQRIPTIGPDGMPVRYQPNRQHMSLRTRFDVLECDGFRCRYCGATSEDAKLVVDHVIPVVEGGTNDLDNLVTACHPCNAGKGKRVLRVIEGAA
jgi:hypothetical protein